MRLVQKFYRTFGFLSYWIFALCAALFVWNSFQARSLQKQSGSLVLEVGLTPLQRELFFDYPLALEKLSEWIYEYDVRSWEDIGRLPYAAQKELRKIKEIPYFQGVFEMLIVKIQTGHLEEKAPLVEKIRKGEVWRLLTPCFLHRDILHILFNMSWLLFVGLLIENSIGKMRMLILVLLLGVFSNAAQYLVGGPYFLGFSGVAVGFVGFIYSRKKLAPLEYKVAPAILLFVCFFVISMTALEVIAFLLQAFSVASFSLSIANTAHVSGGLMGILLGRCPFFARKNI
jgi:GlpG protein